MGFHLIALRPEPGLAATLEKARALGLVATGHALSEIRPVAWQCPDPARLDGLLIGSANAILHGGPGLERLLDKPVYAVGEATAAAARAAGFTVAMVGSGSLQGVLDCIAGPMHLLRIAGEEHVPLAPPPGVTFDTVIAYRSAALPLDPLTAALASGEALVLLHSAATARQFAAECDRLGLDRATITLAALGPRIAAGAGDGWAAIHVAARPDEAALLQLAFDLCREPRSIPPTPSGPS
ncbi:uroporphyrinogen-III synthase [Erythrobacter sp. BLCC-B19]|uniref:uroporphyrinogen-III synthase n=1 Tax=Erythrobacter sp. BLCC-B19 TaxID=3025315 RepID=UPI0023624129|nr:uroporphyrinogen-III synthase [Erythrobacter sp. BLCC-B19]WDA41223.1 uroporphyrinogen-III synthase [Erythrobacter sp. BLCC-B19]